MENEIYVDENMEIYGGSGWNGQFAMYMRDSGLANLDGHFSASMLREIADLLDKMAAKDGIEPSPRY